MCERKQSIAAMARRGGWKKMLIWLALAATLAVVLVIWLEWLGSEQPMRVIEIPVQPTEAKTGSRN